MCVLEYDLHLEFTIVIIKKYIKWLHYQRRISIDHLITQSKNSFKFSLSQKLITFLLSYEVV